MSTLDRDRRILYGAMVLGFLVMVMIPSWFVWCMMIPVLATLVTLVVLQTTLCKPSDRTVRIHILNKLDSGELESTILYREVKRELRYVEPPDLDRNTDILENEGAIEEILEVNQGKTRIYYRLVAKSQDDIRRRMAAARWKHHDRRR